MIQTAFSPFPQLYTERLFLRRILKEDVNDIFFLRSDPSVLKYLGKEPAASLREAEEFIQNIDQAISENGSVMWGITLKEAPEKIIGTICFWNIKPANYRAELGYVLHPGYWRQGIMKEAIINVLEYGLTIMKLHSVEALIDPDNSASAQVLEKSGFIKQLYKK
jgi:ribosomal-protein-alanine N-acetyltransferase